LVLISRDLNFNPYLCSFRIVANIISSHSRSDALIIIIIIDIFCWLVWLQHLFIKVIDSVILCLEIKVNKLNNFLIFFYCLSHLWCSGCASQSSKEIDFKGEYVKEKEMLWLWKSHNNNRRYIFRCGSVRFWIVFFLLLNEGKI
jgi:hypothetical protein